MGDNEAKASISISSVYDSSGTDAATQGVEKTTEATKSLKAQAEETANEGVKKLSEALAEMATLAEVVSFLKESTEEFYKEEKAMRAVATAARAFGADAAAVTKESKEWAEQMAVMSGVSIPEMTSALGTQMQRTGDLADAQHRVALAMDIGTATGKGFEYGLNAVNAAVLGQARGLKDLVPGIKGMTDAHEVSAKGMAYLEKHFYGLTEKIHDNAMEADRAKARWEVFKEELGAQVAPAILAVRAAIMQSITAILLMAEEFGAMVVKTAQNAGALATFIKSVFTGSGSISAAWTKMHVDMTNNERDYQGTIAELEEKALKDQEKRESTGVKQREEANKGKLKSDLAAKKEELDQTQHYMVAEFVAEQKELREAEAAHRKYMKNLAMIHKIGDEEILAEQKEHERKAQEVLAWSTHQQAKTIAAAAKYRIQLEQQVANGVIDAAGQAFGIQKELAIAAAVINTYEGATKAIAQGGILGPELAVLVVAAGLLEIAKISQQSAPTGTVSADTAHAAGSALGFDDPNNDHAAEIGGRKWANDMISRFTRGVSAGWAQGMAGGSSGSAVYNIDNRRTNNVSGVGLIDASSTEAMKKLQRGLDQINQNALGASRIGSAPRR
jgi:hypothetical protein